MVAEVVVGEVGEVTDHRPVVMVFAGCWVQLRGGEARRVCFLMPSSVCLSWAAKDGKEKEPIRPVDSNRERD